MSTYEHSLALERRIYDDCLDVHRLPDIFHYWSERYIRPKIRQFGFDDVNDFFARSLAQHFATGGRDAGRVRRFVSLGSGNCDLEIELARRLRVSGHSDFIIDCVDLNEAMLERGCLAAADAGFAGQFKFMQADFNKWSASWQYDAVIANHSLHHVVNLEGLFDELKRSLRPSGTLIVSDMIGRNGHLRWPEALGIVREFWRRLPPSYRFNRQLGIYEELFRDWDCSVEGFEGVRAQDILPLMLDRFHFQFFLPFGNVIDPFIDRAFGYNFDATAEWDRAFIDEVHARDERELAAGALKPTHMLAVTGTTAETPLRFPEGFSPRFCVRPQETKLSAMSSAALADNYQWKEFPHDTREELIIACRRLGETGDQIRQRTLWALGLRRDLEERTIRTIELAERASELDREFQERTVWALDLRTELEHLSAQMRALEAEFERRTEWALRLRDELELKTHETNELAREMDRCLHNPLHYLARIIAGAWNRLRRFAGFTPRDGSQRSGGR